METIGKAFAVVFGVGLVFAFIIGYTSLSWGYVTSIMWNWYIIPLNLGLPNFTIMQFIGISLALSCLLPKHYTESIKKEYRDNEYQVVGMIFIGPWITLLFGYFIHLFY